VLTIDRAQHPIASKLLARIARAGVGDVLVNAGSLPPERLRAAYESADAFILPTLLESFGRPYDEAMHFGLPILTSRRDFARERCRDAAIYFDPLDAASVARAMAAVMEDAALRLRLAENGRRVKAQTPSWDEIAARCVEVLERTAEGGRQWAEGSRQWASGQVGKDSRQSGEAQSQIASSRPRKRPTWNSRRPPLLPSVGMQPADSEAPRPPNPNGVDLE
jgi:hypothetical protein